MSLSSPGKDLTADPGAEPVVIGPYVLLERLGRGGMGVVHRARHQQSGQTVALKTVRVPAAGGLHAIRREIYALAQLEHPGIVRILDQGLHEGMPWYAMEQLDGVTLQHWRIAAGDPVTVSSPPRAASAQIWWTQSLNAAAPAGQDDSLSFELAPADVPVDPRPAPLLPALRLMRRLCSSLSYLHGEGLVHRDLKPDNILVLEGSRESGGGTPFPVLVDFGLASQSGAALGRDALEVSGPVSGTAAYMAPEQGRGELVDARADLYALGCILYELVTGRPPFTGRSLLQILLQHFEAEPEPPSRRRPGIPPELDQLILRLLEKEPRKRLGYATDVSAALGRLGIDDDPPARPPAARAYLYRPGFCGRQALLEQLREHLSALRSGTGAVVLIGGESGAGKTRLLVELSRLAAKDRLRVLTGECVPAALLRMGASGQEEAAAASSSAPAAEAPAPGVQLSGGGPLQAFRKVLQAVADRCRELGPAETERLLGERAHVLAMYEPALVGLPGLERREAVAELPASAAQVRLYGCLAETLAALAVEPQPAESRSPAAPPLLLVLDDLQWADELSLGAIEFLVRAGTRDPLPWLLIGGYRSEEAGPALRKLVGSPGVSALKLERLGGGAVAQIVADMLGLDAAPESFSRFLLEQSEGNPFFVAEYLRAAVGQKLLVRDEAGQWQVAEAAAPLSAETDASETRTPLQALPLPHALLELVSGRLSRLGPDAQQLVEALSVLGREAEGGVLAEVSGLRSAKVMKATLEALNRQVLESTEGERLRFVHDKLREVAYARIGAGRRRELHRAAAEVLEEAFGEQKETVLEALGHHWAQAEAPEKARPCYLEAAQQAVRRFAHEEAGRLYRAYLGLVDEPGPESIEARLELAEKVLYLRGHKEEALEQLGQALSEARRIGHRSLQGRSLSVLGRVHWLTGRNDEARELYSQALELHRQAGDRQFEGSVLGSLGSVTYQQGRMQEALRLYEQAVAIARQAGNPQDEGAALCNLANLHHAQGRLEEAVRLFGQALELLRQAGNLHGEGGVLGNLGNLRRQQGRLEEARQLSEQALELFRRVGHRHSEGIELGNLALLYQEQGQPKMALQLYRQSLDRLRQAGATHSEGTVLDNLASLHKEQGQMEEARQLSLQALELLRQVGDRRFEGKAMGQLALLQQGQGRPEEAQQLYARALELLRQVGDRRFEGKVLGHLALLHHEQGRPEEARQLFEQALELHRQVDNRLSEGIELGRLAELELLGTGDVALAEALLERGALLLTDVGAPLELAKLLCRRGHATMAAGASGGDWLGQAEALARDVEVPPGSELGGLLDRLRRAVAAFEQGEHHRLHRGHLAEDLPEAWRRRWTEAGLPPKAPRGPLAAAGS